MITRLISTNRAALFSVLAAALLAFAAVPAMAQSQDQTQAAPQKEYSQQTLDKFASAYVKLGEIQNEYVQKMQGMEDREKMQRMQAEMNQKMVRAVEAQNLDVETFKNISGQMRSDKELRAEVGQMIKSKTR
ncbi:DUF4168 domain-containing protein [Desulfohalovibrio reitneri]|uniref:DUF4168 domain-containing protein n=1 Tax=Desulfohalovibrio reitneri TaxID=1307759 RepID=UPI000691A25B|nr:DUF4168 domain-containing protein [Desulfohalovibrio reitneri]